MSDLLKTPLYAQHQALGAKLVDFGGWALPVNYGSQIDEHNAVRERCGMFDVSHMTVSDVIGDDCLQFLRYVLANDINKAISTPGKALYSCLLNESGGVIDDLIVYYMDDKHCRLVTNAGTNQKVMAWLQRQADDFKVSIDERPELALIAVQGPSAISTCVDVVSAEFADIISKLKRFQGVFHGEQFVGRTGYTGEDGLEFIVPADDANALWTSLLDAGAQPCGLGARDTLRLEAGMCLYGNDLDEAHSPLESGLSWTVSLSDDREFIGRSNLAETPEKHLVGLILTDRGVLRGHQSVLQDNTDIGEVTSGTFSPTLQQSIGFARVNRKLDVGDTVQVAVRQKQLNATVARFPFVKNGEPTN